MCSKCYKEHQKKSGSQNGSGPGNSTCAASAAIISDTISEPDNIEDTQEEQESQVSEDNGCESNDTSSIKDDPVAPSSSSEESSKVESSMSLDSQATTKEPPVPGSKRERQDSESSAADSDRPAQKNKKRCYKCNCKLELAIREIGRCRCDYIFCQLHRLPEQHDCIFNHKEKGRQAAREKMVSPKKHVGNSLKRIDSDS